MLVDLSVVTETRTLLLAAAFTAVTVVAKYASAWITGKLFRFDRARVSLMFSLSVAQAAATLAAAVVGFEAGVIGETTVNAALLVILVTVLVASWSAGRAAPKISPTSAATGKLGRSVLVPVSNVDALPRLVELSLSVARSDAGSVVPLHVVTAPNRSAMDRGRDLTTEAERLIAGQGAEVEGVVRIDSSVVRGIANTVLETDASLVVIGWTATSHSRRAALGSLVDDAVDAVPAPVVVAHVPHLNVRRIVVMEVRGASPIEATTARDLATSIGRSRGIPVVASCDDDSPLLGESISARTHRSDIGDDDLVVLAAPAGPDLTRTMGEQVASHPRRPLLAIRAFADTPEGFASIAGVFSE
jgi:nucleotide-binding universal stress UspA family protein